MKALYYNLLQLPVYILSLFVKRDNSIWIFGSWKGEAYTDNSKYFFEYVLSERSRIQAWWIVKNKKLYKDLKAKNKPVLYCYSFRGLYFQLKAGACFFTQSHRLDFLGAAVWRSNLLFQLWHGMPLKKILNDDADNYKKENSIVKRVFISFFPWIKDSWDIVISPSNKVEKIFKSAFGSKIKVVNTGFPRNQSFIKHASLLAQPIKNIIYMPTFRNGTASEDSSARFERYLLDSGFDLDFVNNICRDSGYVFHIKLHPSNDLSVFMKNKIKSLSHIEYIDSDFDFYNDANNFDLLITDYSSVFFDFVLTRKPILHVAFDLDDYIKNNRDLYFQYDCIRLGREFVDWVDVFKFISSGSFDTAEYKSRYEFIYELMGAGEQTNISESIFNEAEFYLEAGNE